MVSSRPTSFSRLAFSLWILLGCLVGTASGADDGVLEWTVRTVQDADGSRLASLDTSDLATLDATLTRAWSSPTGAVVRLPMADGSVVRFRLERSGVMPDELAERFPSIRAFHGEALDRDGWTIRAERTPSGFRAAISRPDGETAILEPAAKAANAFRIAPRSAFVREPFRCGVPGHVGPLHGKQLAGDFDAISVGPTIRTYRLAVAATGEYTQFHGGTVESALAAIVTAVNRLNAIFRRDLAVLFALSGRNDEVIFTNPATDPFTGSDLGAMVDENQTVLDSTLGASTYDIGHVFHTSGGGLGALASVCTVFKAIGASGISRPIGDPFVAEYVAHEIGHQFGAPHTFNGSTSSCGPNRSPISAYEPGSGSTIMSYSGLCGAENLQTASDDYFHTGSLEFMAAVVHGPSGACGVTSSPGNSAPRVDAGADRTIPAQTPFTLEGIATDSQAVTVTWEQVDLGAPNPPFTDNGNRPLFRSWPPTRDRSRTFPRLDELLDGTTPFGETLPTTSRNLTFRMTARDGVGGVASDEVVLQVVGNAGPLRVTEPSAGSVWRAGEDVDVLWDPARTDRSPVSCSAVDIDLSWDGGRTWPERLASGVANNGSTTVRVPDRLDSSVRLRVACSDGRFFALSSGNFAIRGETSCTPDEETLCLGAGRFKLTVSWQSTSGETGDGQWVAGTPSDDSGLLYFFDPNNWELLVKVLDGCAINQRYWVFGAATTDLGFTLRVVDTSTGEVETYRNTAGQAATPIVDTGAFATCP